MKKIFSAAIILFIAISMVSCWQSRQEPEATLALEKGLREAGSTVFVPLLDGEVIEVEAGDTTLTMRVRSNSRWKLNHSERDSTIVAAWSVAGGDNSADTVGLENREFTVVVAANYIPDEAGKFYDREAPLTVELFDRFASPLSQTFIIKQKAGTYRISLSATGAVPVGNGIELNVDSESGEVDVTVNSNAPSRITGYTEGTGFAQTGDTEFKITYPENTSVGRERQFEIVFSTISDPIVSATLRIIQQGIPYAISVDSEGAVSAGGGKEITVDAAGGEVTVSVEANAEWQALSPEEITFLRDGDSCTLTYPENSSAEERSFPVVFSIVDDSMTSTTFTIKQRAAAEP